MEQHQICQISITSLSSVNDMFFNDRAIHRATGPRQLKPVPVLFFRTFQCGSPEEVHVSRFNKRLMDIIPWWHGPTTDSYISAAILSSAQERVIFLSANTPCSVRPGPIIVRSLFACDEGPVTLCLRSHALISANQCSPSHIFARQLPGVLLANKRSITLGFLTPWSWRAPRCPNLSGPITLPQANSLIADMWLPNES